MNHPDLDQDRTLTQRMISGENQAWIDFVTRYDSLIHARIRSTWREAGLATLPPETAAEISAEVFTGLLNNEMKSLRAYAGRSRLSTWLCVIVRRTTLRYLWVLRKREAQMDGPEQVDPSAEQTAMQECSDDRLAVLRVARKKILPDDQRILRLFYEEGQSYQQIAESLEVSINTVGPKLDRARRRLRVKTEEIMSM